MKMGERDNTCIRFKQRMRNPWTFELGLALFLFLYLRFIFETGYWSDDRKYEFMHGILQCKGINIFQYIYQEICRHLKYDGRFFPITSAIAEGIPFLLTLKGYKVFLTGVVVVALYLFRRFIKKFTGSEALASLSIIFTVILFSVQNGMPHPVFLCMGGNAIFCLIFLLLSFNRSLVFITSGHKRDLWFSLAWFNLALLTYEAAYPFVLVFLLIFGSSKCDKRLLIKRTFPYVLSVCVMFTIYLLAGHLGEIGYSGTSVNMEIPKVIRGGLVSITAPLPGVTHILRGGAAASVKEFLLGIQILDILVIAIFIYLCIKLFNLKNGELNNDLGKEHILILGLLFILGPAGLMAISEKYQGLSWGNGYLVIVFQYFGWGLLAGWGIKALFRYVPKAILPILWSMIIVLGSGLILLNQQDTRWTIREKELHEPSTSAGFDHSLRTAFSSGLASYVGIEPEKDLVVFQKDFYNMYAKSAMFAETTGREYQCIWLDEIQNMDIKEKEIYAITSGEGWVMLGQAKQIDSLNGINAVDKLWIYCEKDFDRLMVHSQQGLEFLDLHTAASAEKLGEGEVYSFDQMNKDIFSIEPVIYQKYKLGTKFLFTDTQKSKGVYWGSSLPEREKRYTWTDGNNIIMRMELEGAEKFDRIRAEMSVLMVYGDSQQVNIEVNEESVFSQKLDSAGKVEFEFTKPENNIIQIKYEFPDAQSPAEKGESEDTRKLAIAVGDMVLLPIDY